MLVERGRETTSTRVVSIMAKTQVVVVVETERGNLEGDSRHMLS